MAEFIYDFFGRKVYVGDTVAVCRRDYRYFVKAKVIKITPKGVRVKYKEKNVYDTYFTTSFTKEPED